MAEWLRNNPGFPVADSGAGQGPLSGRHFVSTCARQGVGEAALQVKPTKARIGSDGGGADFADTNWVIFTLNLD